MKIKRYDFGTEYRSNTGAPAIVESADGQYVRYDDYKALLEQVESIGAGGVSGRRITTPESPRDGYEELRAAEFAEPVKVPSEDDVMSLAAKHEAHGDAWADAEYRFAARDVLTFASALLARCGGRS